VEQVSWNDCQAFVTKLNHHIVPAWRRDEAKFRLPTEAEWEYACRAGTTTRFYWKDDLIDKYAWYEGNSSVAGYGGLQPHDVGLKKPNLWGLYDMSGNVFEWCQDWYGDYPNPALPMQTNPAGPDDGESKVIRGGGYNVSADECGSATRYQNPYPQFTPPYPPNTPTSFIGFRVVRS
jgi:formylglycine-generating enzyme required for sulfatase activity